MVEYKEIETHDMDRTPPSPVLVEKPGRWERLKHPLFLSGAAGFVYTTYTKLALLYGWATLDEGLFQVAVDLLAYALIGTGVYSTFTKPTDK